MLLKHLSTVTPKRLLGVCLAILASVMLAACGSAQQTVTPASSSVKLSSAGLTDASTCVEWMQANSGQQTVYAETMRQYVAIPAQYQEGALAYILGFVGGKCYRAEAAGDAARTTLASVLGLSSSRSPVLAALDPKSFLKPLPRVTIGNEQSGRWGVVLDTSMVSAQPIPGSTPLNASDRLLEMRVTVTYLTLGPPGNPAFVVSNLQLDELPQDLGLSHVPTETEEDIEESERCSAGGIKDLCEVAKYGGSELVLDADDEGTPGGATTTAYLNSVAPNQSESFWVIAHVSKKVNPTHIALVWENQPLTALPKG